MGIGTRNVKEVSPILSLLVIVIVLAIVFFIRVNLSINKTNSEIIQGKTATTTTHEADVFNTKFNTFQGLNVGKLVKSMIQSIKSSNANNTHKIAVNFDGTEYKDDEIPGLADKIEDTASYIVKITSKSEEGYIETISISSSK